MRQLLALYLIVWLTAYYVHSTTCYRHTKKLTCLEIPDNRPPSHQKIWERGLPEWRYASSNHKTGTFFTRCAATMLHVGHFKGKTTTMHARGEGMQDTNYCIHMARNPFIIVHSAYEYHKNVSILEPWSRVQYNDRKPTNVGAQYAIDTYNRWCKPNKTGIDMTQSPVTYQAALRVRGGSSVVKILGHLHTLVWLSSRSLVTTRLLCVMEAIEI